MHFPMALRLSYILRKEGHVGRTVILRIILIMYYKWHRQLNDDIVQVVWHFWKYLPGCFTLQVLQGGYVHFKGNSRPLVLHSFSIIEFSSSLHLKARCKSSNEASRGSTPVIFLIFPYFTFSSPLYFPVVAAQWRWS